MSSERVPKKYFKVQVFGFKIIGVTLEDPDNSFKAYVYTVYSQVMLIVCVYLFFIMESIDLISKWGDIDNMTFNLCYLLCHFGGISKMAAIVLQKAKVKKMLKNLKSDHFLPNYDRGGIAEYRIISEAVRQTNLQTYFFYTFVAVIVANRGFYAGFDKGYFAIIEDLTRNRTTVKYYQLLPYTTWFPFDTNISPFYEIAFTYQIASAFISGLLIGTCDSFIAGFMIHIKAQLLILKDNLENYIEKAKKEIQANSSIKGKVNANVNEIKKIHPEGQMFIKRYLGECVVHHQKIIHMVKGVESHFNYIMLMQFLVSLALLCLSVFQISINEVKSTRFFSMACFTVLMLFQLLMFCWNGNEVLLKSLEIASAAYDSDWALCDLEAQKALILIIQRAQRPLQITAGKFANLTLETYMSILRASGSYYMVLRNVNQ